MGKVIGIDLGTTNSVASYFDSKNPEIILTREGDRLLPSVIAFTQSNERLVGNPAKSQLITNPTNTVYSIKRLMGKKFSEVKSFLNHFTYTIVEGEDDTLKIKINDDLFSPEEISAMILQKLKESAEDFLHDTVDGAIITVPAYFNDSQRQATHTAGEIAGLKVMRIINEPTAASLSFSLDMKKKSRIVVYDFGGGTIDISILEVDNEIIKVLGTAGDTELGGNDFDVMLSDLIIAEIKKEYDVDLSGNKLAIQRIRDAAEVAKKELSSLDACEINLPFIADSNDGPIHFLKYISRSEFENLIRDKVARTVNICDYTLQKANLKTKDIDEILLVGGSTRIPLVQEKVKEYFGKNPNKKINPDEIVSMGASIQGSIVSGTSKDILLLDVTPLSLGVKTFGGTFTRVIDANTTIPTSRSLVFSTAEDNQDEVEINIYQGEREIAEENKSLGKFTLRGIRPAPKGVPRIEVTFSININGILKVSAIDLSTKIKKEIVVSQSGLLNEQEIKRIKKDAEKFREEDLKRRELITNKNNIMNIIYLFEQYTTNLKLDDEIVEECRAMIEKAKKVVDEENPEKIKDILADITHLNESLEPIVNSASSLIKDSEPPAKDDHKTETRKVKKVKSDAISEVKKDDTRPLKSIMDDGL